MITTNIPIYTENNIVRISDTSYSNLGKINVTPVEPPSSMVLIRTRSLGSILICKDTYSRHRHQLGAIIQSNPNLNFGTKNIPPRFFKLLDHIPYPGWSMTNQVAKFIPNLLTLKEKENKVAFKYLTRSYKGSDDNTVYVKGQNHIELAKCIQLLGWKMGVHTEYRYYKNASILKIKEDCNQTIIGFDLNKVGSEIVELKLVENYTRGTKFYKVKSSDIPLLPTTSGMFCL